MRIEINPNEMAQRLKSLFKEEHQDDIVEVLLGALQDNEHALSTLFKKSLGITPSVNYKIGDEVLVRGYDLESWRFNADKTEKSEYGSKGFIICKITEVNKYAYKQYTVSFTAIKDDDKRAILKTNINEKDIKGIHENL